MDNITIVLPVAQINIILACLGEQPLKNVLDTFLNVKTQAEAQVNPTGRNRKRTIVLPVAQINIILACLGEQPLKNVLDTFLNVKTQAEAQVNPTGQGVIEE